MSARVHFATISLLLGAGLSCKGLSPYNPDGLSDDSGIPDTEADTDTDTDADGDTDTDTDVEPLSVNSIEPTYGTTAGGTTVTVVGGPFDASARVFFGAGVDETEGTVVSATANQITARTPAYSGETGMVDVKVATDTHAGTGNELFQFFEDGTGLVGALGQVSLFNIVGNYWTPETDKTPWGVAEFFFLEPAVDISWGELIFAPSLDQCRLDYTTEGVYVREVGVPAIRLAPPSGSNLNLPQDAADSWYYGADITAAGYVQNGSYDLMATAGSTTGFPAIEVDDVVYAPGSFQVTAPTVHNNEAPFISQNNFNLSWSGAGSGDYMVAYLTRYHGSVYDDVTCLMTDDGSFKVPSSVFSGWSPDDPLFIILGRVRDRGGVLPHDNSDSGVVGIYFVYGAGFQN